MLLTGEGSYAMIFPMVLICADDPPRGGSFVLQLSISGNAGAKERGLSSRAPKPNESNMPRYATLITGDDGHDIVSAIGEFEGAHLPRGIGRIEQVAPGVRIGMVRGGPLEAVDCFGFPPAGIDARAIAILAAGLKAEPNSDQAHDTAASRRTSQPKPVRAKPRRKPARKKARAKSAPAAGPRG